MEGGQHDDAEILVALATSGTRLLLIGRRAVIAYGVPVVTADYDVWLHIDDIEILNAAMAKLDYVPNHTAEATRKRGRYVLENSEHIDVLVALCKSTQAGPHHDEGVGRPRARHRGHRAPPRVVEESMSDPKSHEEPPLPPEEFARRLALIDARMRDDPDAGEETRELVRWFMRRYPTLIDRCRYATRKHRELAASPLRVRPPPRE